MLAHTDIQREIYEGRIKMRRDQQMILDYAEEIRTRGIEEARALLMQGTEEAKAEGKAEGVLIGRIEFAQSLLHREPTPRSVLDAMSVDELQALMTELEREIRG